MESKVLVIQNHPILTIFYRQVLDVGEETDGDDNLTSISEFGNYFTSTAFEVEVFNSKVGFGYLAHIAYAIANP